MEEQKVERPLMSEEEFGKFLNENLYNPDGTMRLHLHTFEAVHKFKSVRRAIRRGHVSMEGYIYPKRPFGNTKSKTNVLKRKIYEQLKSRQKRAV